MKLKHALALSLGLILSPLLRASDLPAPLPEFMDQQQLAKWSADMSAKAQAATATEPPTQFYTGKPYDADAGGYIFKYRTYNPEMARWTSADPSGYPDGVNNHIYAAIPTSEFDPFGLALPSAAAFWADYSPYDYSNMTPGQVKSAAGGEVQALNYPNTCAIRMSFALNAVGDTITPQTPGYVVAGSSGYYLLRARQVGNYLSTPTVFGAPNGGTYTTVAALISTLNSISASTGKPAIAVLVSPDHTGIITDSAIGYIDPHNKLFNSNSEVWILE
jgi:RHS repeat-associated protein